MERLLGTWRAALLPNSGLRPPTGPPRVDVCENWVAPSVPSARSLCPRLAPLPGVLGRGSSRPPQLSCGEGVHYLQETLSCLQTPFGSIKGCLEVSRSLSAWRRLSQRKLPCPLAGLAPEAEGTAGRLPTPAQGLEPECLGGAPPAPPDPSRPTPLLAPPSFPHASLGSTWRVGRAVDSSQLVPNPETPAAKAPRCQRGAARCQVARHQRPPLMRCGPQVSQSEPRTAVMAEA